MKFPILILLALMPVLLQAESIPNCAYYQQYYQCPADQKYPVHLTFDDGPADVTADILDVLQREGIKATFFAIAERVDCPIYQTACSQGDANACDAMELCEQRRQILQRAKDEGHHIGSHSYLHIRHSEMSHEQMQASIYNSKAVLAPYFTTNPPLFRLPYGDGFFNQADVPHVMQAVNQAGFQHLGWEISAFDWRKADQQGDIILDTVMFDICKKKRGNILFHDGVHDQPHRGRVFTAANIGRWIPIMKCVAEFQPFRMD